VEGARLVGCCLAPLSIKLLSPREVCPHSPRASSTGGSRADVFPRFPFKDASVRKGFFVHFWRFQGRRWFFPRGTRLSAAAFFGRVSGLMRALIFRFILIQFFWKMLSTCVFSAGAVLGQENAFEKVDPFPELSQTVPGFVLS